MLNVMMMMIWHPETVHTLSMFSKSADPYSCLLPGMHTISHLGERLMVQLYFIPHIQLKRACLCLQNNSGGISSERIGQAFRLLCASTS